MEALSSTVQSQLLSSSGPSPRSGDAPPWPKMGVQPSRSGTKQRWGAARDGAAPRHPSLPSCPSQEHRWEPVTPPLQGHTKCPGSCVFWEHREGHLPWQRSAWPVLLCPRADGTTAMTRSSNPPKSVPSASLLPGVLHAPALGSFLPMKLKSNLLMFPFPPQPCSLPKAPGISPSLPLQTSRKLFLLLCLKLQTPVSGREPRPCLAAHWGAWGTDPPHGPWAERCPQGPTGTVPWGCPGPRTQARCSDGPSSPAGLTSAVREPVQRVALVAEALEAAGGVDAEVVAGAVEGALVDVWRKGKGEGGWRGGGTALGTGAVPFLLQQAGGRTGMLHGSSTGMLWSSPEQGRRISPGTA